MEIFLNILKFTIGLPFLLIISLLWFIFAIIYSIIILPLSEKDEAIEYCEEMINNLKKLWSKLQ